MEGRSPVSDPQQVPIVVVDTTVTFDDLLLRRLNWMQLLALSAKGHILLVVPDVVFRESVRHWKRQADQSLRTARSEFDKLKTSLGLDAGDGPPADLAIVEAHEQYLRDRLTSVGAQLPALPHAATPEKLLERDLAGRRPFAASGKGFRDALNWETILELAAAPTTAQIFWVSRNSTDFGDGNGLHPDLADELSDPAQVVLIPTLADLFRRPEFSTLIQDLAASLEELEAYLSPMLATTEDDVPAQTTDHFIRFALVDAAQRLLGESVDSGYAAFEPDARYGQLELPGEVEDVTIDYVDADPDTAEWQVYESYDGTTLLVGATIEAELTFEGFVSKSAAMEPEGFVVREWDWNDHYSRVAFDRTAVLSFQLRVEEGVGVDSIELESAEFPAGPEVWTGKNHA